MHPSVSVKTKHVWQQQQELLWKTLLLCRHPPGAQNWAKPTCTAGTGPGHAAMDSCSCGENFTIPLHWPPSPCKFHTLSKQPQNVPTTPTALWKLHCDRRAGNKTGNLSKHCKHGFLIAVPIKTQKTWILRVYGELVCMWGNSCSLVRALGAHQ